MASIRRLLELFAIEKGLSFGRGCDLYTPKQWEERGERYGTESELVIVYESEEWLEYFNLDYMQYSKFEEMIAYLAKYGYYAEPCTGWYAAIYEL